MGRGSAHDADEEASPTTGDIFDSMLRKAARVDRFTLPAALPHIQQVIGGKYRIEHRLGRGGMGAVFRATHMVSRKSVALKWMLRSTADENAHRRFLREALAAGRIDHPNVVDVYDVGEEGPCAYLVMELLHGEALRARLGRGPLRPRQAATLLLPAMRGVSAAHRAGVIHRDLKPDNIFLCTSPDGAAREAKVLDFGIASVLDDERADPTLTRDGAVLGTPVYMSPEQLQGARDLDVRTDVYAFGVILYEALVGRRPFNAESYPGLILEIVHRLPTPPRELRSDLPHGLEQVVLRALAKDREDRYQNIDELIAALGPFASAGLVGPQPGESGLSRVVVPVDSPTPSDRVVSSVKPSAASALGSSADTSQHELSLQAVVVAFGVVLASVAFASAMWLASSSGEEPGAWVAPAVIALPPNAQLERRLPAFAEARTASATPDTGALPRSCEEARNAGRGVDEVTKIDPDGTGPVRAFEVFCAGMAGGRAKTAREYLPLVHTKNDRNFTRFVYGDGACPCPDLVVRFTRVRLDPRTLTVDPTDVSFANYDRPLSCEAQHASQCGESPQLIWGGAGSCRSPGDKSGSASIDLRGTSFALSPSLRFVPAGFGAAGEATISRDRKTATLVAGGRCGTLVAEQARVALVADR